jgi:RNA polymerase sigma-70 factor (ECF subfamily)
MTQRFQTTRWSLIFAAGEAGGPESRQALSSLCEVYWYPLYAFVRRQGHDADAARDLTQAYFLTFLEKDYLSDVTPEGGRFRSFLLASLKHFLSKARDRDRAAKRGGGRVVLAIDLNDAEARFLAEHSGDDSPEAAFERQWATTILERAMSRLQDEANDSGKEELFFYIRGHLTGESKAVAYAEIAERLAMSDGAVKVAVHRGRRRFGELLRVEIAETVAHPDDVDVEVRYLLEILRR